MSSPHAFLRADIGREMYFHTEEDEMTEDYFEYQSHEAALVGPGCSDVTSQLLDGLYAAHFTRYMSSSLSLRLRKEDLQKDFEIKLQIRTYDQDGLIFASVVNLFTVIGLKIWLV